MSYMKTDKDTHINKRMLLKLFLLSALLICSGAARAQAQTEKPAESVPVTATLPKPSPTPAVKEVIPKYLEIGRSVRGRPIIAIIFPGTEKRVMVLGAIHGNEPYSAVLAKALAATLSRDPLASAPTIIIVPEVNPDGLVAMTRVNSAGVDINRNFPSTSWKSEYPDEQHYPGKEPATEPETRAVIKLIKDYPPDLLITIHAALGCMNWDGPGAEIAALMASINEYELCPYLGYETPGSLGTYAGIDLRIPTVTIELRDVSAGELVRENLPALRAALIQFTAPSAKSESEPKPK
jgi:protein MpaA